MMDFDDATEISDRHQMAPQSSKRQKISVRTVQLDARKSSYTSEPELDENVITERRMKEVLGRMYNDKKYLEKLIEQTGENIFHISIKR